MAPGGLRGGCASLKSAPSFLNTKLGLLRAAVVAREEADLNAAAADLIRASLLPPPLPGLGSPPRWGPAQALITLRSFCSLPFTAWHKPVLNKAPLGTALLP